MATILDDDLLSRKRDHIELCADPRQLTDFRSQNTLLHCVRFMHQALPELALNEIDTHVKLLGKSLSAPLVISAMTGGPEESAVINRSLASVAQRLGIGFALGSQRAMLRDPQAAQTFNVRAWAPTIPVFSNISLVQAKNSKKQDLMRIIEVASADALCVHLNPAMELIQAQGDRDFTCGIETLQRLVDELPVPIIVKETGCGLSEVTLARLKSAGVHHVDVAGAGGTSWVGVETLRARSRAQELQASLGSVLWDWGVPTAASVVYAVRAGFFTIGSGGLHNGLEVAQCIALGAGACGIAAPVLRAFKQDGEEGVYALLSQVIETLRCVMLLVGARDIAALQKAPIRMVGELKDWL